MNRRQFARAVAGATAGAALASSVALAASADEEPIKLSVMLWTVYRDLPFEQRLERVSEAGYTAVELVKESENWSVEDFRRANAKRRELGITFDATGGVWEAVADPSARQAFLAHLKNFLPVADQLECPSVIVLSGNRIDNLSAQAQHDCCIETLKRGADIAARQNISLLLENIDPEENPKYYLTSVAEGLEIVRKVDNPHVRFLYDFYHEQISEGNLIEKLEKNIGYVGLVHIADVPGRHEPGTGEINYTNIFRKLAELKYRHYAAMEFFPSGDPMASLRAARDLALHAASQHGPAFSAGQESQRATETRRI